MTQDDANRDGREPRARLRAVHPLGLSWAVELERRPTIVGRLGSEDGTPSLRHGTVSRRHFEVRWDELGGCHVGHDLGSHNGSRVDGQGTGSATIALHDGAVLQLGDVILVYELLPADARTATPPLVARISAIVEPGLDPGLELPTRPRGPSGSSSDGAGGHPYSLHPPLPGDAPASEALRRAVEQIAPEPTPVLLRGEPGVGKERVARELHRRSGRRGTLVVVRGASLDPARIDELLRSAQGGTLFVDGVNALAPSAWASLQRALHEREASPGSNVHRVRLVAAAPEDIELEPERRALFSGAELRVPPLRERRGDLLVWLDRLYTQWLEQRPDEPIETLTLSPEAVERVLLHPWRDNLRELDRLVHELASDPDLPRPIPLPRLPGWLLRGSAGATTMPIAGPPMSPERDLP